MEKRQNRISKNIIFGVFVAGLVGVTVATEAMSLLGLADNYIYIASATLLIGLFLFNSSFTIVLIVLVGIGILNLPEANLQQIGLDKDIVMAIVGALIVSPGIYRALSR